VGYDLFPTICDWLNISNLPSGIEGGSLASVLKGESEEVKRENDFLVFHFPHYQLQKGSHPVSSIVWKDFKLLKFYETGDFRLYYLKEDTAENLNLATIRPDLVKKMDGLMEEYLIKINAKLPKINPDYNRNNDPGREYQDRKYSLMNEPYFIID